MEKRRTGDRITIQGEYQYLAALSSNPVQRFWHTSKIRMVAEILPPHPSDHVLDVGCGSGVVTDYIGQFGSYVTGVDANPGAIEFASMKFQRSNVNFELAYVDEDFSNPASIDKIYCFEVIEHIYPEQGLKMLQSFYRLLKPGGMCMITTPNYASSWPVVEWLMDLFHLAPKMADDQHVAHYTARKINQIALAAGFQTKKIYYLNLVAPWLAFLSWPLALKIEALERKFNLPVGMTLTVVLRKPS